MIETVSDCERFKAENIEGDWFLHVIPADDVLHPAANKASILFIRNLKTKKTYYLAMDHPDSHVEFPRVQFVHEVIATNPNRKWVLDKKAFQQMMDLPNLMDVNLASYLTDNEILTESEYETPAHFLIRKHAVGRDKVNMVIPLLKHKEMFDDLANDISSLVKKYEPDTGYTRFNDLIIGTLGKLEAQGIFVDREMFKQRFGHDVGPYGITYSQYNVYTSTGRPSNRFGGVNYAALNTEDGTRKCFRSRYGKDGQIVVIDYSAFHPRIVAYLTNYDISIETDIYAYLAKLYFHKKEVDETDIKEAKNLTFRQLYGGVEDKYSHIKYFGNLKEYINSQWLFFQKEGYIITPFFKRKITNKHIKDPNPHKVFNYMLQAVEGEISISKLKLVIDYLQTKHTRAVLYTYDAIMYDFYKPDGMELLMELKKIMSFDEHFPMKIFMGETYQNVHQITL